MLARVQATPVVNVNATSIAVTFTTPPTVGHAVIVTVLANTSGAVGTSCTDTSGNAYTLATTQAVAVGVNALAIYYCPAITATGSPFTVTVAGAGMARTALALAYSGVGTGLAVESAATGTNGAGATTMLVGPLAAVTADDIVLIAVTGMTIASAITVTAAPWTEEAERLSGVPRGEIDSQILGAALGAIPDVGWTFNVSTPACAAIVAFKATGLPITGSAVFGVKTTVRASRAIAFGLDGATNLHDDAGTLKVFGNVAITGDLDVDGALPAHATTHEAGGVDPMQLDDLAAPSDNTDLNASTTAHGLLPKLSGLDVQVLRGDGTWANSPLTSGVFAYVFNTVTTAPPASQRIRFNAGHPYTAVTKLWADFSSSNSEDLYWGWMRIRVGSLIIVQDKDNHLQFAEFITTGAPIDLGTYVELPVAWVSNGTALAVQAVLTRVTAPAPGGSGSNAFGTIQVSGQSDVVAEAAPDTLTLVAGSGVTITTNAGSDSVTIAATGGSSELVLIEEKVCSGSTSTETFSSIPGTYRHLRVVFTGRVTATGSGNNNIYAQFNGDTAANYDFETVFASSTTAIAAQSVATATPAVFVAPQISVTAGLAGGGECLIPYYAQTTFHKTATSTVTSKTSNSSGGTVVFTIALHWRNTAAITSLLLGVTTSGNFASGSRLALYGVS